MDKIKVLYICEALGGGVRRHLIDLIEGLEKTKFEIHLIYSSTRADKTFMEFIKSNNREISLYKVDEMVREISLRNDFKAIFKIMKVLKKVQPDIVHCHSSKAGALGRFVASLLRIKKIYYTPHAYYFQDPNVGRVKRSIFIKIEQLLARVTDKVIHVSKGEEQIALENNITKIENSVVIKNGVKEINEQAINPQSNSMIIATIARLNHQKNPIESLKIIDHVLEKHKEVVFWWIGDGPLDEEAYSYVERRKLSNRIIFKGFQVNATEYLKEIDLFLTSSLYEGLPYSLIEALSYKVPIIASDVTGNNEIIDKENGGGFLYELGDTKSAANQISKLIEDKSLHHKMSLDAYNNFLNNFTLDIMISKYTELYS